MTNQKTFNLIISKVDKQLYNGDVISVIVPGTEGVMTILANHEPLISTLKAGKVVLSTAENAQETFNIDSGVIEVSNNQATILL